MSTVLERPAAAPRSTTARGRWIDDWRPEDPAFWAAEGRRIARKNLALSVFSEHIGFAIWVLWTIVVLNLGNAGISLGLGQLFWLTAAPNLVGSFLRIPYTFAIPRFGGRLWTGASASLLLIPCVLLAVVVPSGWLAGLDPGTQFWVLLACAATAGFGGGNFSSSMANISFFYPEGRKGLALGLNAAGGNLGVALAQLAVPLVLVVGVPAAAIRLPQHEVHLAYAGLVWLPFVVLAALLAWRYMDSLTQARSDTQAYRRALRHGQTWIVSALYIGTFGSFIGYSFALPLVIRNTFPEFLAEHAFIATYLAGLGFAGALLGSIARPFGGWLADRVGGARVTLWCFAGMGVATGVAIAGVQDRRFPVFFGAYMAIFALAGMGNGSTYRMIPAIFAELGRRGGGDPLDFKRRAAAVIGIAGAIGAFGGFLIQLGFRQASLDAGRAVAAATSPAEKLAVAHAHAAWSVPALWAFLGAYVLLAALTWFCYLRRPTLARRLPTFAHAEV
jgi:NNP family nitrate/nitrite transporter-like MFS transporter